MKFSQMNDCYDCCLYNTYCNGGVKPVVTGNPIFPPCTDHPDMSDKSFLDLIEKREANHVKEEHEKNLDEMRKKEKKAKRDYIELKLKPVRNRMSELKKKIKSSESSIDEMKALIRAKGVADSIVYGNIPDLDKIDSGFKDEMSVMEGTVEALKNELNMLNGKALRMRDRIKEEYEYKIAGFLKCSEDRKPASDFARWKGDLLNYVSVDTVEQMNKCMRDLKENGFSKSKYLMAFVKEGSDRYTLYAFSEENGKENLGYVSTIYNPAGADEIYKDFLNSVNEVYRYDKAEVVVMPSSSKFRFLSSYPACFGSSGAFWSAMRSRGFRRVG